MLARSINLLASTGPISTLRKLGCRNETTQILSGAIAAKPFFAVLNDRSVIQVKGPDALEFIQGLCTNDLHKLDCDDRSSCAQYAAFLAPKGRILAESIIHAVAKDEFLIDVDSSRLSALGKHLLQYKVRRNATVKNAKDLYEVRAVLGGTHGSAPGFEDENKVVCSTIDPRWNGLGERGIFRKAEDSAWDTKEMTNLGFIQKTSEDYNKFCSRVGIGQGSELADLIPLQTNLDMLNGVSFSKGCYLGQELVARSHFKGTIRKRILPVEISSLPGGPEDDVHVRFPTPVMLDSRKIGKLLGQHGQYGVALLAIEHFVTDDGEFETQANDRELHTDTHKIVVKGLPPYWDNAYVD